ncbi:MAG: hypothetical protein KKE23_02305 [Nanoarchaeota archaeon]|nr:hypothetical protein [Nanoarchaeota archaeon]
MENQNPEDSEDSAFQGAESLRGGRISPEQESGLADYKELEVARESLNASFMEGLREKLQKERIEDMINQETLFRGVLEKGYLREYFEKAEKMGIAEKELDHGVPQIRNAYDSLINLYTLKLNLPYKPNIAKMSLHDLETVCILLTNRSVLMPSTACLSQGFPDGQLNDFTKNLLGEKNKTPREERELVNIVAIPSGKAITKLINRDEMAMIPEIKLELSYENGEKYTI